MLKTIKHWYRIASYRKVGGCLLVFANLGLIVNLPYTSFNVPHPTIGIIVGALYAAYAGSAASLALDRWGRDTRAEIAGGTLIIMGLSEYLTAAFPICLMGTSQADWLYGNALGLAQLCTLCLVGVTLDELRRGNPEETLQIGQTERGFPR